MNRLLVFLAAFLSLATMGTALRGDETEVRRAIESYVAAFNQRDWTQVGTLWTEEGVHSDRDSGRRVEGRQKIVAEFTALMESQPNLRLSARIARVRFIRADVAQAEGQSMLETPGADPLVSAFSAILVNQEGRWWIDSIEEGDLPVSRSPREVLRELEWLVGHWVDESEGGRVETSIRWAANQSFLLRSFEARDRQGLVHQGTQVIGFDPRSREIRSWTFDSEGSFGDGVWSKNGDAWLIRSSQTLADGRASSGTFVLKRPDDNTMTLQLIGHEIEGEPQPASEIARVVRVMEPAPATATPSDR